MTAWRGRCSPENWLGRNVVFAPAAALRPLAGSVIVGAECRGFIYLVQPRGAG